MKKEANSAPRGPDLVKTVYRKSGPNAMMGEMLKCSGVCPKFFSLLYRSIVTVMCSDSVERATEQKNSGDIRCK